MWDGMWDGGVHAGKGATEANQGPGGDSSTLLWMDARYQAQGTKKKITQGAGHKAQPEDLDFPCIVLHIPHTG